MKKLIFILTCFCLFGTIVLGVRNRQLLENTNAEILRVNEESRRVTEKLGAEEDSRDQLNSEVSQATDLRNEASAKQSEADQKLKIARRTRDEQKEALEKARIRQQEIDLAVAEVFKGQEIKTLDALEAKVEFLENYLANGRNTIALLEEEIGVLENQNTSRIGEVGEEETHQIDRAKKIALGQLEAVVIATNRDWRFTMINIGRAHGLETGATLLVKRDNAHIARLRIENLHENLSVCRTIPGSERKATNPEVGDKVIVASAR